MTESRSAGTRCVLICGAGLLFCCGLLHVPTAVLAHRGVHEALTALDQTIERDPENARLYLRRGDLHRVHRDWAAALTDYERARGLDPQLTTVDFCIGRMLFEASWMKPALVALDRFLELEPGHLQGRVYRARVLAKLGLNREATVDYTRVISASGASRKPRPEYYLERARTVVAQGDEHIGPALRGIDEGLERLGSVVTLQLYAIELERKRKHYNKALRRVESIADTATRKESWLARRGDILAAAGRIGEARLSYTAALAALNALHPQRRTTRAMLRLRARLEERLAPETQTGGEKR